MHMRNNFISSFGYASRGILKLFRTERNASIHLAATILVIILGIYLEVNITEWCLLVLSVGMVFGAEGLNTAIEQIVDLVSPEIHDKAGMAKDIAAGGVLLSAICAAIVGALIFVPKIVMMF